MRTSIKWRAIPAWPNNLPATKSYERQRSPFRTTWSDTLGELDLELQKVNARNVVIELDVPERDIRRDGQPKADARTRSPGVILTYERHRVKVAGQVIGTKIETQVERFIFPCDRFHDWQDNVLAIARSLNALRMVDRYGVTRSGEQYAGFKALPASTEPTMSVQSAAAVIRSFLTHDMIGDMVASPDNARRAIRAARMHTHPDRGGAQSDFIDVNRAAEVLEKHHGAAGGW